MTGGRHRVRWSKAARRDLALLVSFIADKSPTNALEVVDRVHQAARSLCTMPLRGRIVPELQNLGIVEVRELIAAPFRIAYRVSDSTVEVIAVWDGRREVRALLLERKRPTT